MTTIRLEDMQRDLLSYLAQVRDGDTLLITHAGQPVAELRPVTRNEGDVPTVQADEAQLRPIGLAEGQFTVPDDFDDPLPEEILRLFEGEEA
jgi:antitoxin (DNA-binding transcriptional repressor) of toxin-antitoxin stability system